MQALYLGVDGGATKCMVRLEDEAGHVLGQGLGGSANLRLSVPQTWHHIQQAIATVLEPLSLTLTDAAPRIRAGFGLAGCEMQGMVEQFLTCLPCFHTVKISSDADVACLGAHGGQDGAIIIAGTGVAGYHRQGETICKVSGWGFPHDDLGGGAWLGLTAVQLTLQWLDGRGASSALSRAVYAHFDQNLSALVAWANQAASNQWATLAPLVVQAANAGDEAGIQCMQAAAQHLSKVSDALLKQQHPGSAPLPCALIGSIATHLAPWLSVSTKARLVESKAPPEAGAILLVRQTN